jgi:hypothetical protein
VTINQLTFDPDPSLQSAFESSAKSQILIIYPSYRNKQGAISMSKQLDSFLYSNNRYHGEVKPQNLVFNNNLQEFTQKVSYICSLETAGKLTPEDSYKQIKSLWKELKRSKKELGIGEDPFLDENDENKDMGA